MSLLVRARHRLCNGSFSKRIYSPVVASDKSVTRHYAQAAKSENGEEEEIEIDQRRLPADYDPSNFDPTEHRSPPSATVWRLVDEMAALTLAEAAELSLILRRRLSMKEDVVVGVMKPGAAGVAGGATKAAAAAAKADIKPEKTAFELKIESFDAALKLKVIKEIRSFTDLGLKEAKELVEKVLEISS